MAWKVLRAFVGKDGRAWKVGEPFQGEQAEIEKEKQAGNIVEEEVPERE